MKQAYQMVDRKDSRALAEFLSREGQLLLPMLELLEQADPSRLRTRMAVDELIDVAAVSHGKTMTRAAPCRTLVVDDTIVALTASIADILDRGMTGLLSDIPILCQITRRCQAPGECEFARHPPPRRKSTL